MFEEVSNVDNSMTSVFTHTKNV